MYWKTVFGPTGALEAFVKANKRAPVGGFVSIEVRRLRSRRSGRDLK